MTQTTNYNEKYTQLTTELRKCIRLRKSCDTIRFVYNYVDYDVADRAQRIRLVDAISRDYMEEHAAYNQRALDRWRDEGGRGERPKTVDPNVAFLQSLTDAILDEELTDTYRGKSLCVEYPFLSERQMSTRYEGEVSLKHAEETGLDGRNYAVPHRRKRKPYENRFVDNRAKIRNKSRAVRYRKEIAPGTITSYNLRETGGELAAGFVECVGIGDMWRRFVDQSEEVRDTDVKINA